MKTTPWSERPLILHLCSRTFLLSSMVSGVEILKLWPVAWKPSVNPYRTWQKLSTWCMVKNKNKNKHSDSSAFKAITTTLTDTFFVKCTWILKSSTASWESSCPGIKLLCFFFLFFQWLSSFFIQWMMTCNFVSVQRWKDNPCMPKGLVYEGVQVEPMEYSGGSAAQSSLLHCFDELLGVKHEAKSSKRGVFELLFSQQQRHTER